MGAGSLEDFQILGRYTILICAACELIILLQAGNLMFMVFGGATPALIGCKNQEIPPGANFCDMYHNGTCDPVIEYQFLSVNVEFEHYCQHGKFVKDSTSYQMMGYMLGAIVFGQISDYFGRKRPMFLCVFMTGVLGVASAFTNTLFTFTIVRTILSFFYTGHIVIVMVYMCEKFPKKYRMPLNFIFSWSPNIMMCAIIAYFCQDWRTYSIALNVLAFVACGLLLFAEESVMWLIRKGRIDDAKAAVERIYKFNGHHLDADALEKVIQEEREKCFANVDSKKDYFFQHLFCSPTLLGYSFSIIISYFAVSVINYGIMFNMETLSGSMYFNTLFIGGFRFVLNIISATIDINFSWVGRKTTHYFFSGYAIVAVAVVLIIHLLGFSEEFATVIRYLITTSGSMVCQIYVINGVTCSEIFPTPVRNIAYAMTQISASLGSIFGPQLFLLNNLSVLLPFVAMILLQAGETLSLLFFIPESKGKPMADQMPSNEERFALFRDAEDKISDIEKV